MKFYSEEHILKLEKSNKKLLIFLLIFIFFILLFIGISYIFVTYKNKSIFKIVDSMILSIGCFIFLYGLLANYFPCKRLIDHIDEITYSKSEYIVCEILDLSNIKTHSKNIKTIEVRIRENGQEKNIYYLEDFKDINLNIGKKYKILVSNNFVKEITSDEI